MTHRLLLTASLLALAPFSATAGGLNAPVVAVAPIAIAPAVTSNGNWDGLYVGGSLGYAFNGDDRVGIRGNVPPFDIGTLSNEGPIGDIHLGYRWQFNNNAVGVELGVEGGSVESTAAGVGYNASMELNKAISLRVNAGRIVNAQTLVYGFAGATQGDFDYAVSGTGAAGVVSISDNLTETGYVVGLGAERTLTENWSVRAEYQYSNFGRVSVSDAAGNITEETPDYHAIKLGVNYSF